MTAESGVDGDYIWSCYKVDRKINPYMSEIRNPLGYTYTGLSATMSKARSWVRETIARDRLQPRKPIT